jgi:hypothetical protein
MPPPQSILKYTGKKKSQQIVNVFYFGSSFLLEILIKIWYNDRILKPKMRKKILEAIGLILTLGVGYLMGRKKNHPPVFESIPIAPGKKLPLANSLINRYPVIIFLVIFVLVIFMESDFFKKNSFLLKTSLISLPQTEFSGTTMPIKKVPNWVDLSESERLMSYDQLPKNKFIDLPPYNTSSFRQGMTWSATNADQRNAYVSFPVPNMGNYKLDGTENSGSHTGVDIKVPIGTPVHSIANGIVYKVGFQSTGFGRFVSVAHVGVPDPNEPGKKTTLVSTYAHLNQTLVKEGQTIKKDQIIGKSGKTGMATSPHLHFQIDRSQAPFIPYWPFSWKDVQAAGLNSYFDAVKNGVGKTNGLKYTVHPVNFVYEFDTYDGHQNLLVSTEPDPLIAEQQAAEKAVEEAQKLAEQKAKAAEIARIEAEEKAQAAKLAAEKAAREAADLLAKQKAAQEAIKQIEAEKKAPESTAPKTTEITTTKTQNEKNITDPSEIELAQQDETLKTQYIAKSGQLQLVFDTDRSFVLGQEEPVKIYINRANLVADAGISLSSTLRDKALISPSYLSADDFVDGVAEIKVKSYSPYTFKLIAKGDFGELKSPSLKPQIFRDVPGDYPYADAIFYLKDRGIIQGYFDQTFRPESSLNRAESLKIILEENDIGITNRPTDFTDVRENAWYTQYVGTGFYKGIIKGYEDKTFRPSDTVSRAEFLKMAIVSAGFTPSQNVTRAPYTDVRESQWYAPYFEFAKNNQLLRPKNENFMAPNNPITRGEASDVLYRLSRLK